MRKQSWWQLPYVGLALVSALAWGAGSTYWYVCKTEQLCGKKTQAAVVTPAVMQPETGATESPVPTPAASVIVATPAIAKVYFLPDSTDEVSAVNLDAFAAYAKDKPSSTINVGGFFANVDSTNDGGGLSQSRADVVKQQLVALGVPAGQIVTMAKGADLSASTADDTALANARRVEVSVN